MFDQRLEWFRRHKSRLLFVAGDTLMEIWARRLAAWGHVRATGNRRVADQMMATQPPGALPRDVAPKWLVAQAKLRDQILARDVAPMWLVAQARRRQP